MGDGCISVVGANGEQSFDKLFAGGSNGRWIALVQLVEDGLRDFCWLEK